LLVLPGSVAAVFLFGSSPGSPQALGVAGPAVTQVCFTTYQDSGIDEVDPAAIHRSDTQPGTGQLAWDPLPLGRQVRQIEQDQHRPASATVTSATLQLCQESALRSSPAGLLVRAVTGPWTEIDVTWAGRRSLG
jgi:hypothetical protein